MHVADGVPMAQFDAAGSGAAVRWSNYPASPYYGGRALFNVSSGVVDCMITDSNGHAIVTAGRYLLSVGLSGSGFDAAWSVKLAGAASCPAFDAGSGRVVVATGSKLISVRALDGTTAATANITGVITHPLAIVGRGLFVTSDHVLYIAATAGGSRAGLVSVATLAESSWGFSSPTTLTAAIVVGGTAVLADASGTVTGVSSNGTQLWQTSVPGSNVQLSGSALLGFVYVVSGGVVTALDVATGRSAWLSAFAAGAAFTTSMTAWNTVFFGVSSDGVLHCVSGTNGLELWLVNGSFTPSPRPVLNFDGSLLVGDVHGRIVSLVAFSGSILWSAAVGMGALSQIVVSGFGTTVIGSGVGSSALASIRTCGVFPDLVATLSSRAQLEYYVTYSSAIPTNAVLQSALLTSNGARTPLTPIRVNAYTNSTLYRVPIDTSAINLQFLTLLIPAIGIRTGVTMVLVPGPSDPVATGSIVLANVPAASLKSLYVQQLILVALCGSPAFVDVSLGECSISSYTASNAQQTVVEFQVSSSTNINGAIAELTAWIANGNFTTALRVGSSKRALSWHLFHCRVAHQTPRHPCSAFRRRRTQHQRVCISYCRARYSYLHIQIRPTRSLSLPVLVAASCSSCLLRCCYGCTCVRSPNTKRSARHQVVLLLPISSVTRCLQLEPWR